MSKQKKITTDDLAIMIKRGFDETAKKADMEVRFHEMATKKDIARLEKEIAELRVDMTRIGHLPESLGRRVDHLEDDMRILKTKARIN